jgi:hypothetical protein
MNARPNIVGLAATSPKALAYQPFPYSAQEIDDAAELAEPAPVSTPHIADAFVQEAALLEKAIGRWAPTARQDAGREFVARVNERAQALADADASSPRAQATPRGQITGIAVDAVALLQGLRARHTIGAEDVARIDALLRRAGVRQ